MIGKVGQLVIMDYKDFQLDDKTTVDSLKILINQCWKTLPIYEGKNKENKIVYSRDEACENYRKHLDFLVTKMRGASKIWVDNQYYVELVYILTGMQDIGADEHHRVKYLVLHCTNLINSMIKEVMK